MGVYLIRRALATIPTLLGVAILVFVLFNMVGGDPALMLAGKYATPERLAEIRHQNGWDLPMIDQFWRFLKEIVTFNFGQSHSTRQNIGDMILAGLGPTLSLAIPAFLITTVLSVGIALVTAYYRGRSIDRVVVILCVLGMSVPALAYILFGQYYLAYEWGIFPISGYETSLIERWQYVALPVTIWVVVGLGYDVRFFRTALLEETNQDYVRTARAKGLSEPRVFFKHVLKNGMVPIITNIVVEIPLLILGAFLLEGFFGIPGLGRITLDALNNSDMQVIRAMTMLQAVLFILGTLATDILYTVVDPRVSLK